MLVSLTAPFGILALDARIHAVTVVDVEFPPDSLPDLLNALEIQNDDEKLTLEVEQHIGNNWVRCLALGPTEGLARGNPVIDTGQAVSVPVGKGSLGRLFNVVGEPIDNLGPVNADENLSLIHI